MPTASILDWHASCIPYRAEVEMIYDELRSRAREIRWARRAFTALVLVDLALLWIWSGPT